MSPEVKFLANHWAQSSTVIAVTCHIKNKENPSDVSVAERLLGAGIIREQIPWKKPEIKKARYSFV